jgi:tRNA modification GTPase
MTHPSTSLMPADDGPEVALLTGNGEAALAVIGLRGASVAALLERCFRHGGQPLAVRPPGAIITGHWCRTADATGGEQVVVVRVTRGEWEIHCHGGRAAPAAILADLERSGATRMSWPDWFAPRESLLDERPLRVLLSRTGGRRAACLIGRQVAGLYAADIVAIECLLDGGDPRQAGEALARVKRLEQAAHLGCRIDRPWRVVFSGRVNAGKSSLVNALAGYGRSIVSPVPGTTRDLLETRVVLDGWEVDLIDTAGHWEAVEQGTASDAAGIARGRAALDTADLIVCVVPASDWLRGDVPTGARPRTAGEPAVMTVLSQVDLLGSEGGPGIRRPETGADVIATSAATGEGVDLLAETMISRLVAAVGADQPGLLAGGVPITAEQIAQVANLRRRAERLQGGAADQRC